MFVHFMMWSCLDACEFDPIPWISADSINIFYLVTHLTLVSVAMESSGQENATIFASLSALISPSTSRLKTKGDVS